MSVLRALGYRDIPDTSDDAARVYTDCELYELRL